MGFCLDFLKLKDSFFCSYVFLMLTYSFLLTSSCAQQSHRALCGWNVCWQAANWSKIFQKHKSLPKNRREYCSVSEIHHVHDCYDADIKLKSIKPHELCVCVSIVWSDSSVLYSFTVVQSHTVALGDIFFCFTVSTHCSLLWVLLPEILKSNNH